LASAGAAELFDLAAAALAQGLACDLAAIEARGGAGPSLLAPAGGGRELFPGEDIGGGAAFVQTIANILATALDRRSAEERIARLAQYDALTGLPNRTLLRERLAQATVDARRYQRHVAVMFLDLDEFKLVNDSFGHGVGDEVLVRVAQRLRESVRDGDTVGRLGGDEFAIVLSDMTSPRDAHVVAQRIADSLAQPVVLDGREIRVTASIGIAVHPGAGDDPAMLLKNADAAMYRAKQRGRDGCEVYAGA
jgi:diguanylate cyclase (GGDEF)-like protein